MKQSASDPREQGTSTTEPAEGAGYETRRGAIGKALIVWLASGSFLAAVVAFFIFAGMGC